MEYYVQTGGTTAATPAVLVAVVGVVVVVLGLGEMPHLYQAVSYGFFLGSKMAPFPQNKKKQNIMEPKTKHFHHKKI